jgi:hypothetical protein
VVSRSASGIQHSALSNQPSQATRFFATSSTTTTVARERLLLLLAGLFTATGLTLLALVRTQSDAANIVSHVSLRLDVIWLVVASPRGCCASA